MPFAANHSANLPREFHQCDQCGKRGVYRYGGTVLRAANGQLGGISPGRRCKYCGHRTPDLTQADYEAALNSNINPKGVD